MSRLTWTLAAAAVGILTSTVFSALLQWPRAAFVAVHSVIVLALVAAYLRVERVGLVRQVQRRWQAGLIVGAFIGALIVRSVLAQPGSPAPQGAALAGALAWFGVVYGTVDALLLSVIPVLTLYGTISADTLKVPGARLRWGVVALLGSALVTAAYHWGFVEFRGPQVMQPIIGNTLITLAYLLSGNPLAPVVAHVVMHVASVLHGMQTTVQLPPHY
ncbi:MAG TPA: CPBP family glutamic-type intramembrane protease [Gemmatimonadaceae bacterium]|nr:CPBP family glutamic-type intramembrane protease [Gemmatimonadaceae bacterium]